MKKSRRYRLFLSFCLFCMFCFTGSETAEASDTDITALVTAIQNQSELAALPAFTLPLRSTQSDDNMEKIYLLALNYQTVSATVAKDGKSCEETLSVAWDFSSIDQTAIGEYAAIGSITLPTGYAFDEGVLQELRIPVLVKEMSAAVITSVESWYPYTNAYAVPQGSSAEALAELFASSPYYLECYTEDEESYTATVEWDFSGIDFDTVGLYDAKGSLPAPEDTVFAEGLQLPDISIPISVQAAGKPDINCLIVARGRLLFPWVTPPGNLDEISVWLSEDDGAWVCLEEGFCAGSEMLSLNTYLLTFGSTYRLQADYDGGQTGIMSFTYADEIVLLGYHDGDRDGGDADGDPSKETTQPAPEASEANSGRENPPAEASPSETTDVSAANSVDTSCVPSDSTQPSERNASDQSAAPSADQNKQKRGRRDSEDGLTAPNDSLSAFAGEDISENAAVSEFFGETTDRISGARLLLMLQAGNHSAVFSKQGITISIPEDALPNQIRDDDQIEVTIQKEEDGGFSFSFFINGTALDFLPGVLVMLPCSMAQTADTLYLLDEAAFEYPMIACDPATETASFVINHTGTYHTSITEDSSVLITETAATERDRQAILLFFLPVCLLLLPVGASFFRRRQK